MFHVICIFVHSISPVSFICKTKIDCF